MINIKVTLPGFNKDLSISQFIGNTENILDGCKFWINEQIDSPDIWFVFENVIQNYESCKIDPKNIIFLSAETSYNEEHFLKEPRNKFLNQFGATYSSYSTINGSVKSMPFLPWMINSNHGNSIFAPSSRDIHFLAEMDKIEKPKILSVICSDKNFTPGHKKRLDFVFSLKEHFGESLDWYGNGVNPLEKKWSGIAPYKYNISIENKRKNFVISEKLYDSFLGLSFPFYYGAPNVSEFFPEESYSEIDIEDVHKSIEVIEEAINNNAYEENYKYLLQSKNLVLKEYNLFYRLVDIAKEKSTLNKNDLRVHKIINLEKFQHRYETKQRRLKKMYDILRKIKKFIIKKD